MALDEQTPALAELMIFYYLIYALSVPPLSTVYVHNVAYTSSADFRSYLNTITMSSDYILSLNQSIHIRNNL